MGLIALALVVVLSPFLILTAISRAPLGRSTLALGLGTGFVAGFGIVWAQLFSGVRLYCQPPTCNLATTPLEDLQWGLGFLAVPFLLIAAALSLRRPRSPQPILLAVSVFAIGMTVLAGARALSRRVRRTEVASRRERHLPGRSFRRFLPPAQVPARRSPGDRIRWHDVAFRLWGGERECRGGSRASAQGAGLDVLRRPCWPVGVGRGRHDHLHRRRRGGRPPDLAPNPRARRSLPVDPPIALRDLVEFRRMRTPASISSYGSPRPDPRCTGARVPDLEVARDTIGDVPVGVSAP